MSFSTTYLRCRTAEVRKFLAAFMIWSCVIDLGGGLGIKYLSIFLSLAAIPLLIVNQEKLRLNIFLVFIFGLWPVISLLTGFLHNGDPSLAISQLTPLYVALLFYLFLTPAIACSAVRHFFNGLYLLSIVIIVMFLLFIVNMPLALQISEVLTGKNLGYFGTKSIGDVSIPGIYFKPTLFLPAAFIWFCFRNENVRTAITLLGILLSFSKAAIALTALFISFQIIMHLAKTIRTLTVKPRLIFFILLIILSVIFMQQIDPVREIINHSVKAFTGEAATTQVRIGHFESIVRHFRDHPQYFFFGQGLGTGFFSTGAGRMVTNIELDYLETIRKFGILWFSGFFLFLSVVFFKLIRHQDKVHVLSFLVTVILVGTNPLLINPLFMIYLLILYKLPVNETSHTDVHL